MVILVVAPKVATVHINTCPPYVVVQVQPISVVAVSTHRKRRGFSAHPGLNKNWVTQTTTPTVHIERCNLFVNENFTMTCGHNIFLVEKLVRDKFSDGSIVTYFNQIRPFSRMSLTGEASRIMSTPNAGGSSVESETLSFEILKKFFNARLIKTEMEVAYWPEGGSITDFVVCLFDAVIGVSVTRAMKYKGDDFTVEDATALLYKKLKGIAQSSRNTLIRWDKQILHVWLMNEQAAHSVVTAWDDIEAQYKTNTVLLITLAGNSHEVFCNPPKVKKRK